MTERTIPSRTGGWGVPVALIALCAIPLAAGAFRLTELAGGTEVTPANARFFASPLPVALHIVSAGLYPARQDSRPSGAPELRSQAGIRLELEPGGWRMAIALQELRRRPRVRSGVLQVPLLPPDELATAR